MFNRTLPTPDPDPPMLAAAGPISLAQLVMIETRLPTWATATMVYRDAEGNVVGYGHGDRDAGAFIVVAAGPSIARLLSASPR